MENKESKTVRLSTVILLFIILILVVALVLMYMYYNKDSKNEVSVNNTNSIKSIEENNKKELSVTSSTVKEVYNYIPAISENAYADEAEAFPNAYQKKMITVDDLNSKLLLAKAYDNLEKDNVATEYRLEAKKVTEQALKMYNKEIEPITFSYGAIGLQYKDGTYEFSNGGYSSIAMENIYNIEEAYEENDELYIIDNYIMVVIKDGDIQSGDETTSLSIYDSSDSKKVLEKETINRDETFDYEKFVDYINEKYSSKAKKYKHTFKKNDDGEYYWYSSEPYSEE